MTRTIKASACPCCSGRDRSGKLVFLRIARIVDLAGREIRIDELCPRCMLMRVTDLATGITTESRAYRQARKAA